MENMLCSFRGCPIDKALAFSGVHMSLLPYLILVLSRSKTTSYVLIVEDFTLRTSLFELLSSLSPSSVYHLSHESADGDLTGADLHMMHLFHRGVGAFLLIHPEQLPHVASSLSRDEVDPVSPSAMGSRDGLVTTLSGWGFVPVRRVDSPGTFSVRGAIVDVFCYGSTLPLRLEYEGESLRSARTFDPVTQRMIGSVSLGKLLLYPPVSLGFGSKADAGASCSGFSFSIIEPAGPPYIFDVRPAFDAPEATIDFGCVAHQNFVENHAAFEQLKAQLSQKKVSNRVVFCPEVYAPRVDRTAALDGFSLCHSPFAGAFSSAPLGLLWVSLDCLFDLPKVPPPSSVSPVDRDQDIVPLSDLPWGGPVVHEDLGVGLYRGLSTVTQNGGLRECVALEFKHGDLVHVPLDRLSAVTPYVRSNAADPLTDLRSSRWVRAKQKARRSAGEVVDQFLKLYGQRGSAEGFSFSPDGESMSKLSETFPYVETRDQLDCLEAVRRDMESDRPMDRLICGDVGFGKTEVALRAALKAVNDGKQVLLIAPTTILANQLFNGFSSRLAPLGVDVRHYSRFTPPGDAKKVVLALAARTVDVVVGTQRLLAKKISVPNLGLVIIDEEHRFGAKQKELLRAFRSSVDLLSMSATPIPRTLQFSLVGIRDISTIRTPPRGRLPVITSIELFDPQQIKSAVEYEVGRGGQILFVHSNISEMGRIVRRLKKLLPQLRIESAHGRMAPDDLERVMLRMVDGDLDMLVSTTIIEAGIDLQNVNTILINNAHRYGLAQLYQMRGRVGRSTQQAYCHLLLPGGDLSQEAHERLRTIQYNTELGSGYDVALRDLEIRGGGNLFGVEQSGHLASVGYHLFCKIVREAAQERLSGDDNLSVPSPSKVALSVDGDALIPESYVQEQDDRLYFYRMLAAAEASDDVSALEQELRDRFGPEPNEVSNLLSAKRIRLAATSLPVDSVEVSQSGATIWLSSGGNTVDSVHTMLGDSSSGGPSFTVVNKPNGKSGLTLDSSSTTEALQAIQYTFESRLSPQ